MSPSLTPKAFANFSPRLELATTLGKWNNNLFPTLKGLTSHKPNPFRVEYYFLCLDPMVAAALQPWAEISERLRRLIETIANVRGRR
jgi:hypothetical protein